MSVFLKKNNIISFFLGALIVSCIGVVASQITASNITYNNTTVDKSLDDLYDKTTAIENNLSKYSFYLYAENYSSNSAGVSLGLDQFRGKYTYFKLTDFNRMSSTNCTLEVMNNDSTFSNINENTQYSLSNYHYFYIKSKGSPCGVMINLYK